MGVDHDARFLVNPDGGIALDRNQRPELLVRELGDRFRDVVHGLAFLARQRKDRVPAQFGEAAAQFRLEDHHECDREKDRKTADDPANDDEVQQLRYEGEREENDRKTGEDFRAAGPAEIEVAVIDPDAEQQDLGETSPAFDPELEELLHHDIGIFKRASVTRKAAMFSLTS